jgi:predicted porin
MRQACLPDIATLTAFDAPTITLTNMRYDSRYIVFKKGPLHTPAELLRVYVNEEEEHEMRGKLFIAALALLGTAGAHADNVTIYGIVDTGVEYLNHSGPNDTNLVRMPNITSSVPSRFGFRGTEDLGGGTKAFFVLESGFAIDTGSLNYGNRLFGRQANVGLSNQYGSITLGRQYNMTFYALLGSDILGPNIYAMSNLDSYLPNTRSDNAVGYLGKFGGLSFGATYSLGRDAAGPGGPQATNCGGESAADKQACRQWTAMAKYDGANYGVSASYDRMNGGPGALFGLTRSDFKDVRSTLNGYVKLNSLKIGGGILNRRNTSAASFTSNLYYIGAAYPLSAAWVLDGQIGHLNVSSSDNDATILALRTTYNFSRRTAAYITAGYMKNRGTSAISVSPGATTLAGLDQTGVMVGIRHSF